MNKIDDNKLSILAFEVTRRCKFNCRHCRANADLSRQNELTTGQCKKILASVAEFQKCVIILTGGEPTERHDIYDLVRYGRDLGLRMVMATCGYSLNEESIEQFKDAGILAISFSLDGAVSQTHDAFRQTPGAFQTTLKAIELARKAGIRFQINTTISKTNITEVNQIAKLAVELGAHCFNPFILVPTGRAEDLKDQILDAAQYEQLLNDLSELKATMPIEVRVTCGPEFARVWHQKNNSSQVNVHGCMGGRGFGFISYKGDVKICGFLDISAGNLIENNFDFKKIWTDSQFLKQIRDISHYTGKCQHCEYVTICGGCRARAYALCENYLGPDPICNYLPGGKI